MIYTNKIQIALADGHEIVREGIKRILNEVQNMQVIIEGDNGKELIQKMEAAETEPDICVIEIQMHVLNGFETIVEIKKRWPDMKVLILTVFESELYIIRMMANKANGYVFKSSSPTELIKAIEVIHEDEMYYSQHFTPQLVNAVRKNIIAPPKVTPRELQLLKYSCTDLSYADIGKRIRVSERSIEGIRDSLFKKFNIHSRARLAVFAIQFGFVPLEIDTTGNVRKRH